jgi:hypothetical protein
MSDNMHDHLNETLATLQAQGYDVQLPTMAQWWQIDDFAEKLNSAKHLTVTSAEMEPMPVELIKEELPGIINMCVAGYAGFQRHVAERMAETGETETEATDYVATFLQMEVTRMFDKMRDNNPTAYEATRTTFARMFAQFGQELPYPFNS